MTYVDPASSIKVVELYPVTQTAIGTYSSSYAAPTFTRSFDVRPFMAATLLFVVPAVGANVTLDITLKNSDGPDFSTWVTTTKPDGSSAALPQYTSASGSVVYTVSVDLSRTQNALGFEAVVAASSGTNKARFGVFAILHPYDTSNATSPDMEV
tara:strand:+ start:196 stop:657 length:462 start_codon:yes stop_codon:yes gene_type:complete